MCDTNRESSDRLDMTHHWRMLNTAEQCSCFNDLVPIFLSCHNVLCRWQSFYRGGSVAVYVALYAIGFLGSSLHNLNGFLSVLTYLSYMSIMILGLYTAMGTVGFASSFYFVYKIFAAVKQD